MVASDSVSAGEPHFRFSDAGDEAGLFPSVGGIMGHAAGWGDADGNGWPDLYVATFDTLPSGAKRPNILLLNDKGKFKPAGQKAVQIPTRATGAVFADLDNDGDLDLYVSSMPAKEGGGLAKQFGPLNGCTLFRNDGGGKFTDISKNHPACPEEFGGRSACVLDFDGDGLLDLLVGEDPYPGYNGSKTHSSRLLRNRGGLQFEDATQAAGIPDGIPGLGVAAADVNGDGWPDIFLACHRNGNRMFINDGRGKFKEAADSPQLFKWEGAGEQGGDNMICGVCFGDVNRDGRLDMVLGQHYSNPWLEPVPNRLYLNRGGQGVKVRFEDVTEKAGLIPLAMKAPHVEVQDFDNDGWFDISTSFVKFADGKPHPVIFRNLGAKDGLPRFEAEALSVNDFPNAKDKSIKRSGPFFEHMIAEKKVIYTAPGPSADYNRDGRLDFFLPNWWPESRSLLLKNETPGGNWIEIRVEGSNGVNRMGVGSRVNVYEAGKLGQPAALVGCREIAIGFGYASAQEGAAHFGLGDRAACDVQVLLPHGKGKLVRRGARAGERITLKVNRE